MFAPWRSQNPEPCAQNMGLRLLENHSLHIYFYCIYFSEILALMRYSSIRVEIKFTTTTTTTLNSAVALSRNAEICVSCHTVFEHRWRNALMPLPGNFFFNRLRLLYSSMIMKITMTISTTDSIKALRLRLLQKFSQFFLCVGDSRWSSFMIWIYRCKSHFEWSFFHISRHLFSLPFGKTVAAWLPEKTAHIWRRCA